MLGDHRPPSHNSKRFCLPYTLVELTATEYALLYDLAVHAGRVLTHDVLLQRVWGPERTRGALAGPRGGEEAPPQAGRRRAEPHPHLHRAPRRLKDGEEGGAGDPRQPFCPVRQLFWPV